MPTLRTSNRPKGKRVRMSAPQILELRRLLGMGMQQRKIAAQFGLSEYFIWRIKHGWYPRYIRKVLAETATK